VFEPAYPGLPSRVAQRLKRDERFGPISDDDFFTVKRFADQFREMRLGLMDRGLRNW